MGSILGERARRGFCQAGLSGTIECHSTVRPIGEASGNEEESGVCGEGVEEESAEEGRTLKGRSRINKQSQDE